MVWPEVVREGLQADVRSTLVWESWVGFREAGEAVGSTLRKGGDPVSSTQRKVPEAQVRASSGHKRPGETDHGPGSMHEAGCSGLVHWNDPEGWDEEGGGRGVRDAEHMSTHG